MPAEPRQYDIVLHGATGFTGRLVADYLAATAPVDMRWAISGRDADKLRAVQHHLDVQSAAPSVEVVVADSADPRAMMQLAQSARVVATTVGPFQLYGAELVAACAAAGTDYADITGEPEFVDRTWLTHHDRAQTTGARLVHCCGFDSVPHDLGAWWTLQHLPADQPVRMRAYVRARGSISSGTYQSALLALGRSRQRRAAAAERLAREVRLADREVTSLPLRPHREPGSGRWAVRLPTIDPIVIRRSARGCAEYGPDFRYGHFAVVGSLPALGAAVVGTTGLMVLAQVPPTRTALSRLLGSGSGPDPERRANSWFRVRFVATAGDEQVVTEVSGGDPGYGETAKMLAESALCLAQEDLPGRAGQLTPVQAMGPQLLRRLTAAGLGFDVLSPDAS